MKKLLPCALMVAALAGCGLPYVAGQTAQSGVLASMAADSPIVNLTGVPIGVQLNLVGDYQGHHLTGTGEINALDSQHLAVSAHVTAHVLFITESKDITFTLVRSSDPTWPYLATAVNVTDNQTYVHKATLASQDASTSTFTLDDGTQTVISTNGTGQAQIVYGDFNLTIGGNQNVQPAPSSNPPTSEIFFPRIEQLLHGEPASRP